MYLGEMTGAEGDAGPPLSRSCGPWIKGRREPTNHGREPPYGVLYNSTFFVKILKGGESFKLTKNDLDTHTKRKEKEKRKLLKTAVMWFSANAPSRRSCPCADFPFLVPRGAAAPHTLVPVSLSLCIGPGAVNHGVLWTLVVSHPQVSPESFQLLYKD